MRRLWKSYNLSIVLAILFVVSWAGQACFQWREFGAEQREHNQSVHVGEYVDKLMSSTRCRKGPPADVQLEKTRYIPII